MTYSQNLNEYIRSNVTFNGDLGTNADFADRGVALTYLSTLSAAAPANARALLTSYITNIDDAVIVILRHPLDGANEKLDKFQMITLTGSPPNSYILEKKQILFVILGGEETIQQSSFKIIRSKSFFRQSFDETIELMNLIGLGAMSGKAVVAASAPIRIVELNPEMVKAPCKIEIDYPGRGQDVEVNVHEESNFSLQVGVSASEVDKNNLKIENQQLIVELDNTQKEEWKSNLSVFLTFHPGRDIDRFKPIWKQDLRERGIQSDAWKWYTYKRMGLFTGLKLSVDPIENLYLGLNYAITKEFYINYGIVWQNQVVPSVTDIGTITSVDDALEYTDREYKSSQFIGISFSPSSLIDILGLGESKE